MARQHMVFLVAETRCHILMLLPYQVCSVEILTRLLSYWHSERGAQEQEQMDSCVQFWWIKCWDVDGFQRYLRTTVQHPFPVERRTLETRITEKKNQCYSTSKQHPAWFSSLPKRQFLWGLPENCWVKNLGNRFQRFDFNERRTNRQ